MKNDSLLAKISERKTPPPGDEYPIRVLYLSIKKLPHHRGVTAG